MTCDLSGGLPDQREYVLAEPPETVGMRDAVNMWIWDDRGRVGLPRTAVEAIAPDWTAHEIQVNVTLPGGRILREWATGAAHRAIGAGGEATVMGAGPIEFVCVEPFRRYLATFDGEVTDTSFDPQARGEATDASVRLSYEIECVMVAPPWIQGTMSQAAATMLASSVEGSFMGGDRYEQLCRARGTVRIGNAHFDLDGGGLRVRRQGVRNISGFWGHCWQSTVFPSGKGFGYIAYPPRPDGEPSYNEGYVFTGTGELVPAVAVEAPWLTRLQSSGEDVSLVLESRLGRHEIAAETVMSAPHFSPPEHRDFMPPLAQAIVRYRWNDEEACGMMERSNLRERVAAYP